MKKVIAFLTLSLCCSLANGQSATYQEKKARLLREPSPFQDEIEGKAERLVYEDKNVVAFPADAPQMPIHLLIVPKKRIPTLNDVGRNEKAILQRMVHVAIKLAKQHGIAESGYRLAINTNENAGQSVFHIHLHLLGGHPTGPMVEQSWRNHGPKPSASYLQDLESVKTSFLAYYEAWRRNDSAAVMRTLAQQVVIMPQGLPAKKDAAEIREFWFPQDGSRTTVTRFDVEIQDLKLDLNTAIVRSNSILSFRYEKDGQIMQRDNQAQQHLTHLVRQKDGSWKVGFKMWSNI
jgi:histidine triad (HIT) family protein